MGLKLEILKNQDCRHFENWSLPIFKVLFSLKFQGLGPEVSSYEKLHFFEETAHMGSSRRLLVCVVGLRAKRVLPGTTQTPGVDHAILGVSLACTSTTSRRQ